MTNHNEPPIQDLIKELERLKPSAHSPELSEQAYRQAVCDCQNLLHQIMGDASTRKDEAVHNGGSPTIGGSPSEISLTIPEQYPFDMDAQGKILAKCPECNKDHKMEMVHTTTKPVIVGDHIKGLKIAEKAYEQTAGFPYNKESLHEAICHYNAYMSGDLKEEDMKDAD